MAINARLKTFWINEVSLNTLPEQSVMPWLNRILDNKIAFKVILNNTLNTVAA